MRTWVRPHSLIAALAGVCALSFVSCSTTTTGTGKSGGPPGPGTAPPLHQLWKQTVGGAPGSEQQLVSGGADPRRVYVSDVSGHVFALDAKTGVVAWRAKPGERTGDGVAIVGNRALLYDTDLGVFALDSATGATVWAKKAFNLPNGNMFVPAAARGIVAIHAPEAFVGVRLADGKRAWSIPSDKVSFANDNPASDGKLIFAFASPATGGATKLLALRPATGATQWAASLPAAAPGASTPDTAVYALGSIVLVVSEPTGTNPPATLLALDAATGTQRWTVTVVGPRTVLGAPIIIGDEVLFPTQKGIQALAVSDGHAIFTTALDLDGSATEVGRCGAAACAIGFKKLFVVDPKGKVIEKVTVPNEAIRLVTSPLGAVFVLNSGTVYGLG